MVKTSGVLEQALEIISKPGCHTTRVYARDVNGFEVPPEHASAVCWCAIGALNKVTKETGASFFDARQLLEIGADTVMVDRSSVVLVNDYCPLSTVREMFLEAIALARKQEASSG